ncbi:hypothetical protein F5888DRAFT_1729167 [Russula emetica]|nr:hypothetical protein F5888DRAFT_1729167 [Russula emetica]
MTGCTRLSTFLPLLPLGHVCQSAVDVIPRPLDTSQDYHASTTTSPRQVAQRHPREARGGIPFIFSSSPWLSNSELPHLACHSP